MLPQDPATTAPTAIVQTAPAALLKIEEREHHPYSPSTLQYLEACSNYKSRSEVNRRAVQGTIGHASVETETDDARLDDDDAAAVADCLDFVEQRRRELQKMGDVSRATPLGSMILSGRSESVTELKEQYLPIDDCIFDDCKSTTAGYVDHLLLSWDETYAELIDWKFGFWAVESADNNLQAIAYALGVFKKFKKVRSVRFWFRQPRINYYTDCTFTREQVPALYLRVQAVVARARKARREGTFATAKPFVPVCNFCDNLGNCPIGLSFALGVAKKFHPVEWPEDITPSRVMDPLNTKLALNLAAVVKIWAESFRRQVTDRVLRRDAPVPEGMYIKTNEGRRKIVNLKRFKEIALKYVTADQYETALDATFGPIEDAINFNAPRGSKKATQEEFSKALIEEGAVERSQGYSFLAVSNETKNQTKE